MVVQYKGSEQGGLDVEVIMNVMRKINSFESCIYRAFRSCDEFRMTRSEGFPLQWIKPEILSAPVC